LDEKQFSFQEATEEACNFVLKGTGTLEFITKLKTLDTRSSSEASYLKLAQTKDVEFRLAWTRLPCRHPVSFIAICCFEVASNSHWFMIFLTILVKLYHTACIRKTTIRTCREFHLVIPWLSRKGRLSISSQTAPRLMLAQISRDDVKERLDALEINSSERLILVPNLRVLSILIL
jgi:hypothetical protein